MVEQSTRHYPVGPPAFHLPGWKETVRQRRLQRRSGSVSYDFSLRGGGYIREGAVLRVRPKAMTVAVIIAGLLPILWGSGTGSEVMSRIAAPMVGGMVTAPLLSLFVIPASLAAT